MKGSRFKRGTNNRDFARGGGRRKDTRGMSAARDLGRHFLHLWTAPLAKRSGAWSAVIDCKHLFGVTT
jgi:hypothetical protein